MTDQPCCDEGPDGHTEQQHHDASACYDQACPFEHPQGGPYPHPCDEGRCPECGHPDGQHDEAGCIWPQWANRGGVPTCNCSRGSDTGPLTAPATPPSAQDPS